MPLSLPVPGLTDEPQMGHAGSSACRSGDAAA